ARKNLSEKIVFTALGGAASNDENSGIGGSSYLLSCGDEAILIDAGARLSPPEIRAQETAKIIHKLPPREYLKIGNDDYPKLKQIFVSGNAGSGKVADSLIKRNNAQVNSGR
ncbi:MAG: hypothetical protein M1334_00240, partial [Patescibacteria group bacterium]|nr:hypothetical protein [Patescibacteria group bacterium]